MLKKLPAILFGMTLTLAAYAATVELKPGHPDTYVVRRGDTLWGIANKFLKKPWQWPEVWQANGQIKNPHLIFPGDVINLAYLDGGPHLNNAGGPHVRVEQLEDAIKPIALERIDKFLKRTRIIGEDTFKTAPHVVGVEEAHLRATPGQLVYVRGLTAQVGDQLAVVHPLGRYYEIVPRDGAPQRFYRDSTNEIDRSRESRDSMVWHHGPQEFSLAGKVDFLGYEGLQIGTVRVTRAGNPASVLLLGSDLEIAPGDLILPLDDKPYDAQYVPHPPKQAPAGMRVLAFTDTIDASVGMVAGRDQVLALSHGAADGVENGQVYSIFHPGETVEDRYDYPPGSVKKFVHPNDAKATLPEEYVGHVMIFRTFDHVSYGLVMDGVKPIHLFDPLYEPDHL
ncbi:MAG: LysM peptidoglycan-binding domain-containing protein [Proteobacteria bacterium]|nr:LysM peptidoglycan-binding domain-containing protein [Pseudomonadota bacterium]